MRSKRVPREKKLQVEFPEYFKNVQWEDLRKQNPIVFVFIKDGVLQDLIVRKIESTAPVPAASPNDHGPEAPPPMRRDLPMAPPPDDEFDDDLPELPEEPAPPPPVEPEALPAEVEDPELKPGDKIEANYKGSVVSGKVISIEPDETEVVVRLDRSKEKVFIKATDLLGIV